MRALPDVRGRPLARFMVGGNHVLGVTAKFVPLRYGRCVCMGARTNPQRHMALGLSLLLVSCSTTRSTVQVPSSPRELPRYVLVIETSSDGQVGHSWQPASGLELSKNPYRARDGAVQGTVVQSSWTRDCDREFEDCIRMCVRSLSGRNWSHATRRSKEEICRGRCFPAYRDCCNLRDTAERAPVRFEAIDSAVDWVKRNRTELLVGTVVIIAGVTFVVVVAGTGGAALILAPAVLFASAGAPSEPQVAVVDP